MSARSFAHRIGGLHHALVALMGERAAAPPASSRRRNLLQRRVLFGLDLMGRIEEQVVLPALADVEPDGTPRQAALAAAEREIATLRDAALLAQQTAGHNRELAMAVLEGLVRLHARRIAELLGDHDAEGARRVEWFRLEREVEGLLGRWRQEWLTEGDVEDEERDPVGLEPR